ncbi:MAG: hypothetical protein JWN86_1707 [Planctomycetota bacterium]|nr:hypothetical protein [Planctomycetota bacterium]
MTRRLLAVTLLGLAAFGCDAKPKPAPEAQLSATRGGNQLGADGSTHITAPGVSAQVGTIVNAPGVLVKAGP